MLQLYTGGKDGIAAVAQVNGLGQVDGGDGLAFHLLVVPVSSLHALTAQRSGDEVEAALGHFAACQGAARYILDIAAQLLANALQGGDGLRGIARVVAPLHDGVGGIGTHNHDFLVLAERQHTIVLQKYDAFAGYFEGLLLVFFRGNDAGGYFGPLHKGVVVEVAQLEAGNEQATQRAVEVGFLDVATFDSSRQVAVDGTALYVGAVEYSLGCSLFVVLGHVVPLGQEVANGTTVAGNQSLKAPFVAQYLLLVAALRAAGLAVDALIGAHHFSYITFLHQRFEGG